MSFIEFLVWLLTASLFIYIILQTVPIVVALKQEWRRKKALDERTERALKEQGKPIEDPALAGEEDRMLKEMERIQAELKSMKDNSASKDADDNQKAQNTNQLKEEE